MALQKIKQVTKINVSLFRLPEQRTQTGTRSRRNLVSHSLKGQKSEWNQNVNRVAALSPKTRRESFLASSNFSLLHTFLDFCLHNSILCFHVHMVFVFFLIKTLSLSLESTWIIQSSHNSVQNANCDFCFLCFSFLYFNSLPLSI